MGRFYTNVYVGYEITEHNYHRIPALPLLEPPAPSTARPRRACKRVRSAPPSWPAMRHTLHRVFAHHNVPGVASLSDTELPAPLKFVRQIAPLGDDPGHFYAARADRDHYHHTYLFAERKLRRILTIDFDGLPLPAHSLPLAALRPSRLFAAAARAAGFGGRAPRVFIETIEKC
jgi:hypothetical protein